jgi:ABC-type nitrate/sulfonate/bicarbonate transport system permease component
MSLARRVFWIKLLTILVLIGLWEGLSRSALFYKGVLPSSWIVVQAIAGELADSSFYHDLGITMLETSAGFVAGAIIALLFALVLGTNAYMRKMIEPYIIAIGGTPKIIFLPILFLVFGLGIESKIAKAALSAFFPIVLSVTSGIVQIPPVLLRVGRGFDLSRWQMLTKIYLPAVTNPLLTGLQLGVATAIIGVLSAEISYANAGLGYRLIRNADQFKISQVYAIIILIFTVSATINFAISRLQQRLSRHERNHREAADLVLAPVELKRDASNGALQS